MAKLKKSWLWTQKQADKKTSEAIIKRDGKCMFPGCTKTENLQCSHYIGRATNNTRYYFDNLIALCYWHHYGSKTLGYEYQKQRKEKEGWDGQYTLFMKKWLGKKRWEALMERSRKSVKGSSAIIELMTLINTPK